MAADIYELGIYYKIGPQPGMNVLCFREATENTPNPDLFAHALIAGFVTLIQPLWLPCIPDSVDIVGYKARRLNNGGGPGIAVPMTGVTGERTGTFSSSAIAPCLIWHYKQSDNDWKAGRTFLPAVSEEDIDENVFVEALRDNIQDLFVTLLTPNCIHTDDPVSSFDFVVHSRKFGETSGVESASISGKPGVQNRRMKPSF